MTKPILLVGCLLVVAAMAQNSVTKYTSLQKKINEQMPLPNLPRIAIAGLAIESSTFSPAVTIEEDFGAKYGADVYSLYPFLSVDSPMLANAEWIPTIVGKSLPGGAVTRQAYEALVSKTLNSLQAHLPYNGLLLDIHGAMSVIGLEDPEGDFITRIRKVVGYETVISTTMDLHGNVSWRLAQNTDLITCYRMAPHEDAMDTKKRAFTNLLQRLQSGKGKPAFKAYISIPVLLPGEKTSTRIEPGKSIYAAVALAATQPGIIDAAIWIGYAWADEPRNHAAVMVTGDDQATVTATAEKLAANFWNARKAFAFVAPTASLTRCLNKAIRSREKPFFISDSGDNPTAGGAGDVTWTLAEILKRPELKKADGPSLIYASIPAPAFVQKAIEIGVGGTISAYAGAQVDARFAPPVLLQGVIEAIVTGDKNAETEVVIKTGSVRVIITQKRKPYHKEIDFNRLALDPRTSDIVVVKIGYLEPELYAMQADWLLALTVGGVDQNLQRLPYKNLHRPIFPLDDNMPTPDLSARLVPASGK